jgi:acyl-CoA thioester hydrolase
VTPLPDPARFRTDAGEPLAFDVADPFTLEITAGPADIDPQRHVNNAAYVRWMDRAAFGHSAAVGYGWDAYQRLGASFVFRRHEIDYLAPAFEGERIVLATWPCAMERFTAMRRHQIVRVRDAVTLVRAETAWVYLDLRSGRPRRIPPEMIAAFAPRVGCEPAAPSRA